LRFPGVKYNALADVVFLHEEDDVAEVVLRYIFCGFYLVRHSKIIFDDDCVYLCINYPAVAVYLKGRDNDGFEDCAGVSSREEWEREGDVVRVCFFEFSGFCKE